MTRDIRRSERLDYPRDGWGPGPWDTEPDLVEWRNDEYPGVAMLAVRSAAGHLCGYVGVQAGHPLYGKAADETGLEAHGGLNYAASCGEIVCHVPAPGEDDDVWWLGFDCGHVLTDISPETQRLIREVVEQRLLLGPPSSSQLRSMFDRAVYRTLDYVMAEVERLAEQLR